MRIIGIIGRPNVGKSTLFNRIAGKRIAITDDRPGVTRDRIEADATWNGKRFKMVDTAGFDLKDDLIKREMQQQVYAALELADEFILVTDGIEGKHPLDEIVSTMLHKKGKPFIVAVNKIDTEAKASLINDFYSLGAQNVIGISATHGHYVAELLDEITDGITDEYADEETKGIAVAVIGCPNVGKSSLVNAWLGEERVIVTPIAGTTRDSVDTQFEYNGENYTLIDTAGIRKKSVMFKDAIERIGYFRSIDAIERCNVAVAVIDAVNGINERDVKVIADAWEAGKPVVIAVNKWDIASKEQTVAAFKQQVFEKLQFMHNPAIIFIVAAIGKNVFKLLDVAKKLYDESCKRVATAAVNKVLEEALARHQPPTVHNRRLKLFYMTQASTNPPHFVVFANYPAALHFSYRRFIVNVLRERFGFDGVPVVLSVRKRGGSSRGDEGIVPKKLPKSH